MAPEKRLIPPDLHLLLQRSGLAPLRLKGHTLLPIVQGGMGIGVSAHRLAGHVAATGAIGTLSAVDLRRHHPGLMARTRALGVGPDAKAAINASNLEALDREVAAARRIARDGGLLAMNVMRAVSDYAAYVTRALQAGIDAVVVGAGLPLDLPDLAADHPHVALIPILSDSRGVQLVVRKWERKKRMPDAIVLEHPGHAGGHLGAARVDELHHPRFDFERSVPETLAVLRAAGIESTTPIIAAGGIRTLDGIRRLQGLGATGVQLGTPFAVTLEGDAHPEFKRVLAEARDEDMVEFTSVAGLPARAVATPWLKVPEGRGALAGGRACQAALHPGLRLSGAMRLARRQGHLGPVLHRPAVGGGLARRRQARPVLQRPRRVAVRQPDPQRPRPDGSSARWRSARV